MQPASQPHLIDSAQPKNAYNQYGGNAYQDGMLKTGNSNNWTQGRPQTNQFSNTQSQPQVMTSQHIQNHYRQLQTRQTRRIINANGQQFTNNNTSAPQNAEQRNAYQNEQESRDKDKLGRGQDFVHNHIMQQQMN